MALDPAFLTLPLAHRGLHDRAAGVIENSLSAVRAAIAGGWGIEVDIQPSADGVPMVFHDADLGRLTGQTGPIRDRLADDLQRTALTGSTDTIPTLATVLDEIAGAVPLLIEVKDQDGALGPGIGPLEGSVCTALAGYEGPVAIMSFNPESVVAVAEAAPHIPRGLVTGAFDPAIWRGLPEDRRAALAGIEALDRTGASFISHNHHALHMPRVREVKAAGLPVLTWTIRSDMEEAAAREVADNITFEGYSPARPG